MTYSIPLPQSSEPLITYYLIGVPQGSVAHHMVQEFLNTTAIPYRSTHAENHVEALNDLMDEELFTSKPSVLDLNANQLKPEL